MKILKLLCLVCFSIFVISCATNSNNISIKENNNDFSSVIERVKESIVYVMVSALEDPTIDPAQNSACSGVVVENQYIITNYHCIHDQKYLRVFYWDENDWEEHEVSIIGRDPLADLALLQVTDKETPVPFLKFAESELKVGEEVFAMGHPMGMTWTVTKGILSSVDRFARHPYVKAVQTDAAINKGNSGGPLLNMKGEIVAINSLMISKVSENAGLAISIRADIVKHSVKTMLEHGVVDRAALGIMITPLGDERQRNDILKKNPKVDQKHIPNTLGLLISQDKPIPEELKLWDTVVAVGGVPINNGIEFAEELSKYEIGKKVSITVIRRKRFIQLDIMLKVFEVPVDKMYTKPGNIKPILP